MSTYADKPVRVFRSQSQEVKSRLRRKRSSGRLKAFNSNTDNRSWVDNEDERRRHILELLTNCETNLGNYIPFEDLFRALLGIAGITFPSDDDPMRKLMGRLSQVKARSNELEEQKKELSELTKCLSKAGGDLKKENKCLKDEINRLQKQLADCEACKNKLCDELRKFRGESGGGIGGGSGGCGGGSNFPPDFGSRQGSRQGSCPCRSSADVDSKKRVSIAGGGKENSPVRASADEQSPDPGDKNEQNKKLLEKKLCESELRINELLCEIQGLQKCLEKAECDAMQMIQIIEQQQEQLGQSQMLECKLRDVTKQRDLLKKQCQTGENDADKGGDVEKENDENELKMKENELCELNKKLMKQNECINSLKQMLMQCQSHGGSGGGGGINTSQSDSYCNDLEDTRFKMHQLQCKVSQQATIIVSQRKCLLEQHKYILEQEQIRTHIQNKIRDQSRKQAELVYERNLLRNEIVFLTARLKTYLGKIQVLEKSIEQFFDNTKAQTFNGRNSGGNEDVLATCCGGGKSNNDLGGNGAERGSNGGCCGGGGGGGADAMDFSPNKCSMYAACSSVLEMSDDDGFGEMKQNCDCNNFS